MTQRITQLSRRHDNHERGFTLIELLVVIVILGILAAVVVFAVRGSGDKGKKAAVATDERIIRTALELYCARNGRYPTPTPPQQTPMDVLVAEKFLSSPSQYHTLQTGDDLKEGNCPATPKHYQLTGPGPKLSPPANDMFVNSTAIDGDAGRRDCCIPLSNRLATKEPGEPLHGGNAGGASVWYRWVARVSGVVTFTAYGAFDRTIGAYAGTDVSRLVPLAENHSYPPFPQSNYSRISFPVTGGIEYHIAVDGYNGQEGEFALEYNLLRAS